MPGTLYFVGGRVVTILKYWLKEHSYDFLNREENAGRIMHELEVHASYSCLRQGGCVTHRIVPRFPIQDFHHRDPSALHESSGRTTAKDFPGRFIPPFITWLSPVAGNVISRCMWSRHGSSSINTLPSQNLPQHFLLAW